MSVRSCYRLSVYSPAYEKAPTDAEVKAEPNSEQAKSAQRLKQQQAGSKDGSVMPRSNVTDARDDAIKRREGGKKETQRYAQALHGKKCWNGISSYVVVRYPRFQPDRATAFLLFSTSRACRAQSGPFTKKKLCRREQR